jgi:hypothetical protein
MELALTLGLWGWIAVIVGALIFGVLAQSIGETRTGYEWLIDAIGAGDLAMATSVARPMPWPASPRKLLATAPPRPRRAERLRREVHEPVQQAALHFIRES